MKFSAPRLTPSGLWSSSVASGHADLLLAALDDQVPFVLIETWDGVRGWHEAQVSVGLADEPRTRVVRHLRFEVLVSPEEAAAMGRHLRAQGVSGGGLGCYQLDNRPSDSFTLPEGPGRAAAMRGQGVKLAIELPHDGEVAVVCSPSEATLLRYIQRAENARTLA